eukprot:130536-Chlamydomonas_euryale.AAC.1
MHGGRLFTLYNQQSALRAYKLALQQGAILGTACTLGASTACGFRTCLLHSSLAIQARDSLQTTAPVTTIDAASFHSFTASTACFPRPIPLP